MIELPKIIIQVNQAEATQMLIGYMTLTGIPDEDQGKCLALLDSADAYDFIGKCPVPLWVRELMFSMARSVAAMPIDDRKRMSEMIKTNPASDFIRQ